MTLPCRQAVGHQSMSFRDRVNSNSIRQLFKPPNFHIICANVDGR